MTSGTPTQMSTLLENVDLQIAFSIAKDRNTLAREIAVAEMLQELSQKFDIAITKDMTLSDFILLLEESDDFSAKGIAATIKEARSATGEAITLHKNKKINKQTAETKMYLILEKEREKGNIDTKRITRIATFLRTEKL